MTDSGARWEHFHHGADIGVRGLGKTREEAFEQVALALTAVVTAPEHVHTSTQVLIAKDLLAPSDELLLYDWLNAVVLQSALLRMVFGRYKIEVRTSGLWGWAWGELIDEDRHEVAVEVKGATMTCLAAAWQADGTYVAQCVVDV